MNYTIWKYKSIFIFTIPHIVYMNSRPDFILKGPWTWRSSASVSIRGDLMCKVPNDLIAEIPSIVEIIGSTLLQFNVKPSLIIFSVFFWKKLWKIKFQYNNHFYYFIRLQLLTDKKIFFRIIFFLYIQRHSRILNN